MRGVAKHPFPGVTDFSGFLLTAKASGAQVIAFANGGADIVNCMKEAREFGLPQSGIKMVALAAQTTDLHGMGLEVGQGLLMCLPFYWDSTSGRGPSPSGLPKTQPAYPSVTHPERIGLLHYLKAAEAMGGSDKAKASGKATVDMMKQLPTDDDVLGKGLVRPAGGRSTRQISVRGEEASGQQEAMGLPVCYRDDPGGAIVPPVDRGWLPLIKL